MTQFHYNGVLGKFTNISYTLPISIILDVPIWNNRSNFDTAHKVERWLLNSVCVALHWTIGRQAIYTSLWSAVTLRVLLSTTGIVCCWKKWLVHVRIHNSVWKIFFNVVTFFECAGVGFFSFAWNFSVIFLQQKRNSDTREMLYKMNDIKYKNGINNIRQMQ